LAPDFAAAHGGLARVRVGRAEYYRDVPRLALASAREAAMRALALDPSVSEAHCVIGDTRRMLDMDWAGAEAAYVQSLALNPSNEVATRQYGILLALRSRAEEACWQIDRACELDPLCLVANTAAAWARYADGRVGLAIDRCKYTLDLDPEFGPALRILAAARLAEGKPADARSVLESAVAADATDPIRLAWLAYVRAAQGARREARDLVARARGLEAERYVSPYHLALAYVGLEDHDEAFAMLDRAWLDRDPALPGIVVEPLFEAIRGDSRYAVLTARLNGGNVERGLQPARPTA
jgi:tetratricopeptide (TPR) repeat protein